MAKKKKHRTTPSGTRAVSVSASTAARAARSGIDVGFISGYGRYSQTGPRPAYGRDKARKALPPGWRTSASGNVYFENRRNRSDRNLKKRI